MRVQRLRWPHKETMGTLPCSVRAESLSQELAHGTPAGNLLSGQQPSASTQLAALAGGGLGLGAGHDQTPDADHHEHDHHPPLPVLMPVVHEPALVARKKAARALALAFRPKDVQPRLRAVEAVHAAAELRSTCVPRLLAPVSLQVRALPVQLVEDVNSGTLR